VENENSKGGYFRIQKSLIILNRSAFFAGEKHGNNF